MKELEGISMKFKGVMYLGKIFRFFFFSKKTET